MPGFADQMKILMHVAIAVVLSGLIGFEREKFDKPAGIRTNMIVGGAVALMVSLGEVIVIHFQSTGLAEYIRTDPNRVIQAIIMGVSFIGAGTVLQIQEEYKIKYLTTAATIFFSSGIGIAVALEQYYLAVGVTLLILIINFVIAWIGNQIKRRNERS
ncbi:MAG TPA: MgtC/SapB family protein [Bacteroidales bacterium]|nr:MgtC/SapB family protein [Bacteroidales bacterium]